MINTTSLVLFSLAALCGLVSFSQGLHNPWHRRELLEPLGSLSSEDLGDGNKRKLRGLFAGLCIKDGRARPCGLGKGANQPRKLYGGLSGWP